MIIPLRIRGLVLALTLLASHTLLAAHMATHLGKSTLADCQICVCQAQDPHALPQAIVSIASFQADHPVPAGLSPSPREGVIVRAFQPRAPPAAS